MIHKFTSLDEFQITARGPVFIVSNPFECKDFSHLFNKPVIINGKMHKCIGVERFMHCPPWRAGEEIGLLVKPMTIIECAEYMDNVSEMNFPSAEDV